MGMSGAIPALSFAFVDVPEEHWAYDAVEKLAAAGFLEGDPGLLFEGKRTLTRYEFAQLTWRIWERLEGRLAQLESRPAGAAVAPGAASQALIEGLTSTQQGEVAAALQSLVMEFRPELEANGVAVRRLQTSMDGVVKQLAKLAAAQNTLAEAQATQQTSMEARLAQIEQDLTALKAQMDQKPGDGTAPAADGRVQSLEQAAASLRAELAATRAEQAVLAGRLAHQERVDVTGALAVKFHDTALTGNTGKAYLDPAEPDSDRDGRDDLFLSDRYFRQELSLNLAMTPAPGAQLNAKVRGARYEFDNADPKGHQVRLGMILQTPGALKLLAVDELAPDDVASGFTPFTLDAERLTRKLTDPVDHDEVATLEGALGKVEYGPFAAKGLLVQNYPLAGPGNTGLLLALRPSLTFGPALRVGATYLKQPSDALGRPEVVATDAAGRLGAFGYQLEGAATGADFDQRALHGLFTGDLGAVQVVVEETRLDEGFAPSLAREWDKDRLTEADPDSLWNPGRAELRGAVRLDVSRGVQLNAEAGRRDQQLATDDYYTWREAGLVFPVRDFYTEASLKAVDNSDSLSGDPSLLEQHVAVAWRGQGSSAQRPALRVLADRATADSGELRSFKRWAEAYREGSLGAARLFAEADWGLFTDKTSDPVGGPIVDRPHYRLGVGVKEVPLGSRAAFQLSVARAHNDYDPDPDPAVKDPEWKKWTTDDVTTATAGLNLAVGRSKVGLSYEVADTTAADESPQSHTVGVSLDLPLLEEASLVASARQTAGSRGEQLTYGDLALKYPVGDFSLVGAIQFRGRGGAYLPADNYQARRVTFSGVYSF